ncbi:MAG TPA: dienelactone hydrolase family protein [Bacteroidia bacterium]|nr:dienelactone hydrolase family protein [Bacteroidia bacterium]
MKLNSKKSIFVLALFSMIMIRVHAQHTALSCCSKNSTVAFAMLSNDESFKASHLSPLPFHFEAAKGRMVSILTRDGGKSSAFIVKAENPTNNYVIVIHEWWGLNDYIKQEAEKLQGELVNVNIIAVDLYDAKIATNPEEASKFMGEAKEERIRAIIGGAIDYAGKDARIQTIGWCFGGGWSLQTSIMAGKQGTGCVMYYGMPEKDINKLKSLDAPVLGIFASKDGWITPEVVTRFEKDMKENNKQVTTKSYDADHAFANPSNPKYDKTSADDAHKMAVEFLKAHL